MTLLLWLLQLGMILGALGNEHQELLSQLQKVAGVYTVASGGNMLSASSQEVLAKTVVVTACNYGYLNHLFNFDCFMKRLNMKYLVIAMDKKTYDHLKNQTSIHTYYLHYDSEVTTAPQEFRSKQFNIITTRKKEAVLTIMKLGYHVLFSDTDVAVVRDPLPYLFWKNVDYVHSAGSFCSE